MAETFRVSHQKALDPAPAPADTLLMTSRTSLSSLRELVRSRTPSQLAFLAGAGVSVPSCLPTAWAFNASIARYLTASGDDQTMLLTLLTTGYSRDHQAPVRFEQLLQILRTVDPALAILHVYDERTAPTLFHHFLASSLSKGSAVFTTNFDSLIERAYYHSRNNVSNWDKARLHQIAYETAANEGSPPTTFTFAKYLRQGCPQPALLKLHGTLRTIPAQSIMRLPCLDCDGIPSIGATLDKIGRSSHHLCLELYKEKTLRTLLRKRLVCVLGYSGADDFDILPSLADALSASSGLLWIRHESCSPHIVSGTTLEGQAFLPSALRAVCRTIPSVIACGNTSTIIQRVFDVEYPTQASPRSYVRPMESVLCGYEPYASMPQLTKLLLTARIAEQAKRLDVAKRLYTQYVTFSKKRQETTDRTFALSRLGSIARLQGEATVALKYLRKAACSARPGTTLKASILNGIGTVYLDTGRLLQANQYFRKVSQMTLGDEGSQLKAAALTNLGLVARKQSHYDRALQFHKQALDVGTAARDRVAMARDYGNVGTVYLRMERYQAALKAYESASELARLIGARDTLATVMMNLAIVLKHLHRTKEAKQAAEEALTLEQAMGRNEGIARYWSLMGGLAYVGGEFKKAVAMYRKAIAIQMLLSRLEGLADDWQSLGECYVALRLRARGVTALKRSRQLFTRIGNRAAVKRLTDAIARITSSTK